ncbi:MAG: hypothetical protein FWE74_00770 [Oscillospiraceae bacterium]|nr:hypothetical protein [Oscillospiraceae bacterium]
MKDILEELYFMFEPAVKIKGESPQIISRAENKLCKKLKGKNRKLFNDYELAYSNYNALTAIESFKQGFKKGFDFAAELSKIKLSP